MTSERGSLTLWLLGLAVCVLFLGGISLDLWRAFEARRGLASLVDAAAVAGASGLDTARFRDDGALVLDPVLARRLAAEWLDGAAGTFHVDATDEHVTVVGEREIPLGLVGVLLPGEPLTVRTQAVAQAHRSP